MKRTTTIFAILLLAALSGFAKTIKWTISEPAPRAAAFAAYHGETVEFAPEFAGAVSNVSLAAASIHYQTNGMGDVWWTIPGTTFHPTNDVGASQYRFFVRAGDAAGISYAANGILRMLDSPGFDPAVLPLPRRSLDFDAVEISNAPWPTAEEIEAAAAAALDAAKEYTDNAITAAGAVTPGMVTNIVNDIAPTPGDYENVSNKAVNAVQEVVINDVTNNAFKIAVKGIPTSTWYTNATTNDAARVKIGTLTVFQGKGTDIKVAGADEYIEWPVTGNQPANYDLYAPGETDPTVPSWAKAANPPTETDPTVPAWAKAAQAPVTSLAPATNYTDSVVAPIWQIVLGDRVWFAVTNYMRTVDGVAPSLQLWEIREGVTNLVYHSTEEITNLIGKATAPLATTQALDAVRAAMPSKAWSRYQSATGADNPAPADVTIISTPVVQLTGGGEWTPHTLSAGGTVWTLESNGFTSISGGTNGYFSIRNTVTGEEVLTVEERSIIPSVPLNAAFEAKDGGGGFVYTVYADSRPTLYTSTNLAHRAKAAWDAEGDDPNVVVNSWTNNGDGTWTADVTLVVPSIQYFAYVGVHESKDTIISNKRAASFDGGVFIDGVKYRLGTALINGVRVLTAEVIQ